MSVFLILIHYIHFELECFSIGIAYSGYIVPFTLPHISILKPENLMVQNVMGSACLKLIDFGDARIVYNDNYVHDYTGSAEFRAPEIIRGQAVSTLTDIWYTHVVSHLFLSIVRKNNFHIDFY